MLDHMYCQIVLNLYAIRRVQKFNYTFTYRTTRYSLPLFFLAVKTNVDFQVVASFIIQSESTDDMKEALQILRIGILPGHQSFL